MRAHARPRAVCVRATGRTLPRKRNANAAHAHVCAAGGKGLCSSGLLVGLCVQRGKLGSYEPAEISRRVASVLADEGVQQAA